MKNSTFTKLIFSELVLMFLAATFMSDSPPPGWYQQPFPVNKTINDIFFVDSLKGWAVTVLSSSTDTGYILQTTNGGNNWSIQYSASPIGFKAIQFIGNDTGYVSGNTSGGTGKIYKTTNGGANWTNIASIGTFLVDVCFVNPNTGWVCDDSPLFGIGIIKTTNGGSTWQQQTPGSYMPQKLFFINQDTGWALCSGGGAKLYMTTNAGTNWILEYTFSATGGAEDIFFSSKDTGWAVGGPTGILKSTNGGINWFSQTSPITVVGGAKIFFINNIKGYIGANAYSMDVTFDGINWSYQTTPATANFTVFFIDSLKGWAGTTTLIHTIDGGGPTVGLGQISNSSPNNFLLFQNYPNPFNSSSKIKFQITRQPGGQVKSSVIKIIVYDMTGKRISVLIDQNLSPGTYEMKFDGTNLSSGIYFYTLICDGEVIDTKKMILLK